MRVLWTVLKVIVALAVAIPLSIIVLATALGLVGTLLAVAFLVLKVACLGFMAWGAYRVLRCFLWPTPKPERPIVRELPASDPYYDAAMRELDMELGRTPRS
jgi:threonine/homoserine/homoserine lactone efflux protein